jgi:hypothetical protein
VLLGAEPDQLTSGGEEGGLPQARREHPAWKAQ